MENSRTDERVYEVKYKGKDELIQRMTLKKKRLGCVASKENGALRE